MDVRSPSPTQNAGADDKAAKQAACERACFQGVTWWSMLVLAITAIPLVGASLALTVTTSQMGQVIVFVGCCWLSTWIGMWLMKKSNHFHFPS